MNRDETLNLIMTMVIYHREQTIAIALPTFADVKEFRQVLVDKINEIPKWLLPAIHRDNTRYVAFNHGMVIKLCHSPNELQGMTTNYLFMDRRIEHEEEWAQFATIMVLVGNTNRLSHFDNI